MDLGSRCPHFVFQNQLSGNLLRKFKNSNGWQKLWVVFTNFCLFFYKSHQVSAQGAAALTWGLPARAEGSTSTRHADVRQRTRSRAGRGSSQPCPQRSSALRQRHSTISLTAAAQKGVKHKSRGSLLVFLNLTVDTNRCSGMKNGPKWELEEKDNPGALGIFPKSKGAQSTGREFKSY